MLHERTADCAAGVLAALDRSVVWRMQDSGRRDRMRAELTLSALFFRCRGQHLSWLRRGKPPVDGSEVRLVRAGAAEEEANAAGVACHDRPDLAQLAADGTALRLVELSVA